MGSYKKAVGTVCIHYWVKAFKPVGFKEVRLNFEFPWLGKREDRTHDDGLSFWARVSLIGGSGVI